MATSQLHWPYPLWIAHRGAGKLAPENTLAAFQLGAQHAYRMFECDVKLSADGILYLLHDAHLDRTTNQQGSPAALTWQALAQLDAGSWHSPAYQGEPLMRLQTLLEWCNAQQLCLNIEIKPLRGQEVATGLAVVQLLEAMRPSWPQNLPLPLLSSFSIPALEAVRAQKTPAPSALLIERWSEDTLQQVQALGCAALVAHYPLWSAERVAHIHALGLHALSYTVNDTVTAQALVAMQIDGIITDAIDCLTP